MPARAKLRLDQVHEHFGGSKTLRFSAVYDPSIPEDRRFQLATPSATVEMVVDNPKALEQFVQGQSYYVDFSPVGDAAEGG